jgi:hypothetical protein
MQHQLSVPQYLHKYFLGSVTHRVITWRVVRHLGDLLGLLLFGDPLFLLCGSVSGCPVEGGVQVALLNEWADPLLEPCMCEPYLVSQVLHNVFLGHLHKGDVRLAHRLIMYQFTQGVG